jgi:integrase
MSLGLGAWGGDTRPAITLGPASAFPVPRITSKKFLPVKRRYLTEREVERLIEAAKSNRHGASHIARMNIGPLRSLLPRWPAWPACWPCGVVICPVASRLMP